MERRRGATCGRAVDLALRAMLTATGMSPLGLLLLPLLSSGPLVLEVDVGLHAHLLAEAFLLGGEWGGPFMGAGLSGQGG